TVDKHTTSSRDTSPIHFFGKSLDCDLLQWLNGLRRYYHFFLKMGEDDSRVHTVLGRLVSETGEVPEGGGLLDLPTDITTQKLQLILNTLLQK
ncbi:unnamed protein product, partial [Timema podura]|nr:unnamed protein product [Timema podura]